MKMDQTAVVLILVILVIIMARAESPAKALTNIAWVGAITFVLYTLLKSGIVPKIKA